MRRREVAAPEVDHFAVEQPGNDRQRLFGPSQLLAGGGPVEPCRHLVHRFTRSDAEEGAARIQRLERRDLLGDHDRVVAIHQARYRRAKRHMIGGMPCGAEPHPCVCACRRRWVTRLPPRREVITAADRVETGLFRRHSLTK